MARNRRAAISLPKRGGGGRWSRSSALTGAAGIPRARLTQESFRAYPDPPPGWRGPLTEWACYWWLTTVKKARVNIDFFYQEATTFVYFARGFQRVDFIILGGPRGPASPPAGYRAIAWDPITPFTHRNASEDRLKRAVLASQGIWLVWIDGSALETNPNGVLSLAIKGIDVSMRGRGH